MKRLGNLGYILGLVAYVLGIIIIVLVTTMAAQAATPCLPSDLVPGGEGTPYVLFTTPEAQGRVGWCPVDGAAPGQQLWQPIAYQWCLRSVCGANPTGVNPFDVLHTVRYAANPASAAAALSAQLSIAVAPGSADEANARIWWARACRYITTPPYPGAPPRGWVAGFTFPADFCPPEPPPVQAVTTWRTPTAGTFTLYTTSGGKLTGIAPGKASAYSLCDCSTVKVISGSSTYCPTAATAPAVTLCKPTTQ